MHKLIWVVGVCLLFHSMAVADIASEVPIYAPNPGDPPPEADQIRHGSRIRYAIAGAFLSAAVIASGFVLLRHLKTGKPMRIQDWYLVTGVTVATGIIVGLMTLATTAPVTAEYREWQEQHEAWKRGDIIGVRLETPDRRWYPDPVTGEIIAD